MNIEGDWKRIKAHRERLSDEDIRGLAEILFFNQEDWLEEKLRFREDEALVLEILGCLGHSGSVKAAKTLLKYLEAGEEVIQIAAAESLKLCQPDFVIEPLAQMMLKQGQGSVKAGEIIMSFGSEGAYVLWSLWFGESRSAGLRSQILQLLAEAKDERTEPLAFLAFLSEEEDLIRTALKTAEKMETMSLWGNVAECLRNPSWRIRGRAAQILGQWEEKRALRYLYEMGNDPDPWVEEERQIAIIRLTES